MKRISVLFLILSVGFSFLCAGDRGFYMISSDGPDKATKKEFVLIAREVNGESYYYLGHLVDGEVIDTGIYLPVLPDSDGNGVIYQPLLVVENSDGETLSGNWVRDPVLGSLPVSLDKVYDLDPVFIADYEPEGNFLSMSLTELRHELGRMTSVQVDDYSPLLTGKSVTWEIVVRNVTKDADLDTYTADFTDSSGEDVTSGYLHHIPADAARAMNRGDLVTITAELTAVDEKSRQVFLKFARMN